MSPLKKYTRQINQLLSYLLLVLVYSCVQPYEFSINESGKTLIVESVLTDQEIHQEVKISRSFSFGLLDPKMERNALVVISNQRGQEFLFAEVEKGMYKSIEKFSAQKGDSYILRIQTQDGDTYTSDPMMLSAQVTTSGLSVITSVNNAGEEGASLQWNSTTENSSGSYYRFAYEETYKIIAPMWSPYDAVVVSEGVDTFDLRVVLREQEERICYGYDTQNSIILADTHTLQQDALNQFEVLFLSPSNPKISHRYSVLIKQYLISDQAFSFYSTLQKQGGNQWMFSSSQPGKINGNIHPDDETSDPIVGFFDVAGYKEHRIFFNFNDLFPSEPPPPYFVACDVSTPTVTGTLGKRELLNVLYEDTAIYYKDNRGIMPGGPMLMVTPACGDCTRLGSNKKPDFWKE